METLLNATVRRLVAAGVGIAALALQKKFGLELDATAQAGIVAIVVAYLTQSAAKEMQAKRLEAGSAGDSAAASVTSPAEAAKVLGEVK